VQLSKSYELIRKLAAGGMAEVFLARTDGPKGFSKTLVLKRILPHLAEEEHFVELFLSEARLAAQLTHPNVVQIFDFGEYEDAYYIAMEYIDGPNLRTLWRQAGRKGERLPTALCAKIISYACEGLAYAHDFVSPETGKPLGLIHRDVSADNILVSRNGGVKVVDFGIAKVLGQSQQTRTGTIRGKLPYMPPEQIQAKPLDRRVDIFALGVVLYELLSGKRPFDATEEMEIMNAILHQPLKPIRQRRPDVPEALEKVLQRALAKSPGDRYQSCRHFRADLERFILSEGEPMGTYEVASLIERLFPVLREEPSAAAQPITEADRLGTPPMLSPSPRSGPAGASPKIRPQLAESVGAVAAGQGLPAVVNVPAAAPPRLEQVPPATHARDTKSEPASQPSKDKPEDSAAWDTGLSTVSQPSRRWRVPLLVTVLGALMVVSFGGTLWMKRSRLLRSGDRGLAPEGPPASDASPSAPETASAQPPSQPPAAAQEKAVATVVAPVVSPEPVAPDKPDAPAVSPVVPEAEKTTAPVAPAEGEAPTVAVSPRAPRSAPAREPKSRIPSTPPAHQPLPPEEEAPSAGEARAEAPSEDTAPAAASPSPAPPSTAEPAVEPTPLASVVFESSPPAQLRVNGRFAGFSPVTMRNLEPGLTRVEAYDSVKGFSKKQAFVLQPGDNGVQRVVVGRGTLELLIRPSAAVTLDGRKLGHTPLEPLPLYEGHHELKLENRALNKLVLMPVVIEAGQTHVLRLDLEKP
jgi:serine/threonine protein kinase